ncbi:MAG: pyroglutamyl-peptidase I [Proteobacteria bacterium]|nr:pyroglutamyl-peptidase I [Pseudomonadota bacterium]
MSDKPLRILLTGFGPFPGAPFNPTMPLVARLTKLRRPALDDVAITSHIFDVTYATVDRELPQLLATHRPHALLMFGLAARTPYLRIETRARNAITTIWPDADGTRIRKGSIAGTADALTFGPHTLKLLRAAQATGIDARASRDAGSYLCNYLCWRAIEATRARHDPEKRGPVFGQDHAETEHAPALAAFVHVPPLARDGGAIRRNSGRITLDHLVDAGEAMLLEIAKTARQVVRA